MQIGCLSLLQIEVGLRSWRRMERQNGQDFDHIGNTFYLLFLEESHGRRHHQSHDSRMNGHLMNFPPLIKLFPVTHAMK